MRAGGTRLAWAAAALACAVLPLVGTGAGAAPAQPAHVLVSKPFPDALQNAIDAAAPGATIRVRARRYRESLLIDKPLRLRAVGEGRPTIDALCQVPSAIEITTHGVTVRGFRVRGGSYSGVQVSGLVGAAKIHDLRVQNTCDGAEYGINVFATQALQVTRNHATGFSDAGIYVGEITSIPAGALLVGENRSYGNTKGIIVENSSAGGIRIEDNRVEGNTLPGVGDPTGILLANGDAVVVADNRVRGNGSVGVHLNSAADGNVLTGNAITGNPIDVVDEGSGNCGTANTFTTGGPLAPC